MRTKVSKILIFTLLGAFLSIGNVEAKVISEKDKAKTSKTSKNTKSTPSKGIVVKPTSISYKKPTPTVKALHTKPAAAITITNKGISYFLSGGRYYRHDAGRYIAVAPPVGMKIRTLPVGYATLKLMNMLYYYSEGVYYRSSGSEYIVVDAPNEVTVATLPEEAELITYEGKDYYIYNGSIYNIVITPNGKAFQKVGELGL